MENEKIILVGPLLFLLGSFVGYLVGRKMSKDHYEQLANEEIESVKEYYEKRSTYNEDKKKNYKDKEVANTTDEFRTNNNSLIRNSFENNPNERAKRNYNLYSSKSKDESDNESEKTEDDDEENVDAEVDVTVTGVDMALEDKPYIITDEEYNNEHDDYDKISLYYYVLDDTLCEENEEIIDDIDAVVGYDSLNLLSTQTTVWVRNERLQADYEIIGLNQSYSQTVAGFQEKNLTPREQYEFRNKTRRDDDG